jgi:DNA (cytosine-5)-methyltransferase 1
MGLPPGFVTDVGLPYGAQLKALGNGVVPQQATAALRDLVHRIASLAQATHVRPDIRDGSLFSHEGTHDGGR